MYLVLKHTHMTCAAISILFFAIRGYWMLTDSQVLQQRWVKILPHIVDTLLLGSAIALTVVLSQYPFSQDWLTAKLFALIAYILLGTIALKRGKNKTIRTLALILALTTAGYIIWVALNHYPWPWLLIS